MMGEVREVSFDVRGEFITQMAKEWFFVENRGYDKVMELLLSCMEGTEQSEKELKRLAEDILLGRAALVGSTRDNTYHMEVYEPDEQPEQPEWFNVFIKMSDLMSKLKDTEKELQKIQGWYAVAMEYVPEYKRNDVLKETDQPIESRYGNSQLSDFMERMMDEEEHTTEDYGWLEPNGTFHEVEWGRHQEWATEYVKENFPEEYKEISMQSNTGTGLIGEGDWLVEKGWVLLHSPSQGIAQPTRNPVKRYTKAQQEFLYDYYQERNREKEANAVYEEE
ncbi:hypothetical protein [Blautia sp.]|uniref:hypothetical protein n=1 Tax=Blautia sp. TaxID=1955243 RepID=UPI00210B55F4|nr:hypothetical protein [uncultured Blautia sp.]MCQ4866907.1 hypothetical protein [Blautia producta]